MSPSGASCEPTKARKASSQLQRISDHLRLAGRDGAGFLRLLVRTLSRLPADVLAASVVINLLGLALPLAVLQVYNRIIPHSATATLTLLVIGVFCALLIETILRITRSHIIAWRAMRRAWTSNVAAAVRVATAPAELVDAQPAARWIQRLNAVVTISEFELSPAPLVLIDLVFVAIFLVLLAAASLWLAAVPLAAFLLFGISAVERGRALRRATAARDLAEAKNRDCLIEILGGVATVKALGAEQQILRRYERLSEHAARCTHDMVRLTDEAQSFGVMASILTQIATATVGAVLVINGDISIGVVACGSMLAARVVQPLLRLVSAWNEIQGVTVAEETARSICELPLPRRHPVAARDAASGHVPARISLDRVWFAHDPDSPHVLCDAKLEIEPGEIVAITGRDKIGKSTFARLLAGQLAPKTGQVLIDGIPAARIRELADGPVALIDHHNATVRGTVLNNLTLFRDAERIETARTAARLIGLENDIHRLRRGYETRLGDATEAFPNGLLQRIAIARAIAGRPRALVLDEANSSFDYRSDLALARGLIALRGKITIVLITNRPSFAAIADRLFTIEDGEFRRIEAALPPMSLAVVEDVA